MESKQVHVVKDLEVTAYNWGQKQFDYIEKSILNDCRVAMRRLIFYSSRQEVLFEIKN